MCTPIPNLPIPEEDPNIDYIYLESPDKPKQQSKQKKIAEVSDVDSEVSEIIAPENPSIEKPPLDTDALHS